MCTPDLRGSQGTFSLLHDQERGRAAHRGRHAGARDARGVGDHQRGARGRTIRFATSGGELTTPLTIRLDEARDRAEIEVSGQRLTLEPRSYSPWVPVTFRVALGLKVHGICRFYLNEVSPDLDLYVTPGPDRSGEAGAAHLASVHLLRVPVQAQRPLRDPGAGRGHLGPQRGGHRRGRLPRAGVPLLPGAGGPALHRPREDAPRASPCASSTPRTASSTCSSAVSIPPIPPTRARRPRSTAGSSRTSTGAWTTWSAASWPGSTSKSVLIVMSDHGFAPFRRGRQHQHLAPRERLPGPQGGQDDERRVVRRRRLVAHPRLLPRAHRDLHQPQGARGPGHRRGGERNCAS